MKLISKFETARVRFSIMDTETSPVLGVSVFCAITQNKRTKKVLVRYGTKEQMVSILYGYLPTQKTISQKDTEELEKFIDLL